MTQISLTLFVYLHLWVVIYLPRACNSMFFPFSSPFEHQECPFTSFPVCLVYLRTLNLILWPGEKSRQDCTLVSGRIVLGQEPSCSTTGGFPSSFPQVFPGTKVQPEGIRLLFNSSRILHLKLLSALLWSEKFPTIMSLRWKPLLCLQEGRMRKYPDSGCFVWNILIANVDSVKAVFHF